MKRKTPSSLISFWSANPNCIRAHCFVISLPTGAVLCATDGQWDITFRTTTPGWAGAQTTFKAVDYGVWTRGAITSEAGFSCAANTMDLSCVPQADTAYPGLLLGLLNGALNHLFDGATVWVYAAYMPLGGYGDVSAGVETKFQGTITRAPAIGRNLVQFQVADPLYLLNMKVPSRLLQSNCPWSFADANCTLDPADYTVNFTATTVTQTTLASASLTQPAGYFNLGVVKCLTGRNAGLSQTVKGYAGGVLTLTVPWILRVFPGDTFAVIKGCDKTLATCAGTTKASGVAESRDFKVRFGGTPFAPVPSAAI